MDFTPAPARLNPEPRWRPCLHPQPQKPQPMNDQSPIPTDHPETPTSATPTEPSAPAAPPTNPSPDAPAPATPIYHAEAAPHATSPNKPPVQPSTNPSDPPIQHS